MAHAHLLAMGHKPPRVPPYSSSVGAARALKRSGFTSMEALFDSLLPRIAPAEMLPGDLALIEGEPPFDSCVICVGVKVMGWHQQADRLVNMTPHSIKAAWRG
jgi:hypothetical protein